MADGISNPKGKDSCLLVPLDQGKHLLGIGDLAIGEDEHLPRVPGNSGLGKDVLQGQEELSSPEISLQSGKMLLGQAQGLVVVRSRDREQLDEGTAESHDVEEAAHGE